MDIFLLMESGTRIMMNLSTIKVLFSEKNRYDCSVLGVEKQIYV